MPSALRPSMSTLYFHEVAAHYDYVTLMMTLTRRGALKFRVTHDAGARAICFSRQHITVSRFSRSMAMTWALMLAAMSYDSMAGRDAVRP